MKVVLINILELQFDPPQIKISSSTPVYFIDLLLLLSQHNYKKKKV